MQHMNADRSKLLLELDVLKRQSIRVYDEDVVNVKRLIDAYGISHFDAPGEADDLCAYFVQSGRAWGCISDDMDMFVYGCPRVIRYLSLLNHTAVIYDMKGILENLGVTQKELREIFTK